MKSWRKSPLIFWVIFLLASMQLHHNRAKRLCAYDCGDALLQVYMADSVPVLWLCLQVLTPQHSGGAQLGRSGGRNNSHVSCGSGVSSLQEPLQQLLLQQQWQQQTAASCGRRAWVGCCWCCCWCVIQPLVMLHTHCRILHCRLVLSSTGLFVLSCLAAVWCDCTVQHDAPGGG